MSAAASAARAKDLLRENGNAPEPEADSSNEGSKTDARSTRISKTPFSSYENGPRETKSEHALAERDSYGSEASNTQNKFPNTTSLPPEILGLYNRTEGNRAKEYPTATAPAPRVATFQIELSLWSAKPRDALHMSGPGVASSFQAFYISTN